jgi:uncharacterized membrane protein
MELEMHDINILFVINLFICMLCTGLFMLTPRLTRKSYLFGVKIPAEEANCTQAGHIRKRYMVACLSGGTALLIACVLQFIFRPNMTLAAAIYLPLFIITLYFAAFITGWKRAVRLKEDRGWAVSNTLFAEIRSDAARGSLSSLPYIWYVLGCIIVVAAIAVSIMQYPFAPDLVPVNFNLNMEPDRWAEKTWWVILQMPLINLGFLILMFFIAIGIIKVRLQIDPDNPQVSFAQHRVYRRRMGHALGFLAFVINIVLALAGIMMIFPEAALWASGGGIFFWLIVLLSILAIAVVIAVVIKTGQGGCKVKVEIESNNTNADAPVLSESKMPGRGDDKYWKLGMFYYNPEDPGLLVEDRFGSNLGFNYARLPAKIATAVLLLGLIALYVWLTVELL